MTQKLEFLDKLKNNMGEEMAEMMSEEITKVMDKQREIEEEYAQLVHQRDQLKGITNKHRLEETKKDIQVRYPHPSLFSGSKRRYTFCSSVDLNLPSDFLISINLESCKRVEG